MTATLLLAVPSTLFAGTTVERGDVLRVDVINAPEFSRVAPVDVDGRIALPLLGTITVAGSDVDTIRDRITEIFVDRSVLVAPVILVEVASYRRVYVGGSVGAAGSLDFVPGLTVRQAVIAAGGSRLPQAEGTTTAEATLASLAERRALTFRLAQASARIVRLNAELAGEPSMGQADADSLAPPAILADTMQAEAALLTDIRQRQDDRKEYTGKLLRMLSSELDTLLEQVKLQESEADLQQSEINDVRQLVERGLTPRTRLQELLREKSQLTRDRLETSAFAARARQQSEAARYEYAEEQAKRREALRLELQTAVQDRAALEASIEALDLRLQASGVTPSRQAPVMRVTVHRRTGAETSTFDVEMDEPLQPGDVVDVAFEVPLLRSSDQTTQAERGTGGRP